MDPMTDYEEQIWDVNHISNTLINAMRRIVCFMQLIYDDLRLEVSEYAGLTLAVRDSSVHTIVQPMYDQLSIQIIDDDGKMHLLWCKKCACITHIFHGNLNPVNYVQ